jgi:hypothetical protein
MGTISQRKLADGTIRFRAEIRISRKGLANFKRVKRLVQCDLPKNG